MTIQQQKQLLSIWGGVTFAKLLILGIFFLPKALAHYHSPLADAAPTINVNSLFQHTTSRNQKVITQALGIVSSMQNAPTCTHMAASHLMNECKLLEHAPEFTKSRPEAYLDKVKIEYAAKLAVCELLSTQPVNSVAPPHCNILVPAAKHCDKGGSWWLARPAMVSEDKQCYPDFKEYQYMQCLKSLQSTPQYWTSFSNARQNAIVMCQASRDAIERENHLEIFKNLTKVVGGVTENMHKTTAEYESLIHEQRKYAEEARNTHQELRDDIQAVRITAVATVEVIDNKFNTFMKSSISNLIAALATSQSKEIDQIHEKMQEFLQDLMLESSQLAKYFTDQLQQYHQGALSSLQSNHKAQVRSYEVLSNYMGVTQDTINRTNQAADRSLYKVDSIAQRLDIFESQTKHIAEGFAFLSAMPTLVKSLVHGLVATAGSIFTFFVLFKLNMRLAIYTVGACSWTFLFYTSGTLYWLASPSSHTHDTEAFNPLAIFDNMSSWQKVTGMLLLLWLSAYPICRLNIYLGGFVTMAFRRLAGLIWLYEYSNESGTAYLPCIEIPAPVPNVPPKDSIRATRQLN
ncbi:hypothetical protein GGP41_001816 [Bipolaris sorokiniana]|uniref:Nuclear fusion protein KAR5 n=2 Tax=Cochliobolus sativus TaxID=45130 RepID=A0A8H5ZQM8_COCSA|nr:uncharacterized protein COCSADRAFT_81426 [Bipolaris sorokiniana ND90Pr]EMD68271.1 hypothetical protein COCSADRAFT_81426 [Bipolaris sorokiniana ND90Pr]KAF5853269.1 hypothetical protein GGP41_001816 [Bipolaris sorokiniana]